MLTEAVVGLGLPVGLWATPRGGVFSGVGVGLCVGAAHLSRSHWAVRASLQPSMGIWWYFFAELFAPFGPLYAALWLGLSLFPMALLSFALRRAPPLPTLGCLMLAAAVFLPRPPLLLSLTGPFLLLFFSPTWSVRPIVRVALLASLASLPLAHVTRLLWTQYLNGNVNFFYAATLLQAGANLFSLVNVASDLRVEMWHRSHKYREK